MDRGPRLVTLGCRLNGFESEAMRRLSVAAGLGDAVIVNSCAVTNEAVRQTRQSIRRARRERPGARVIVTGCAAQIDPDAFAAMPEVDAVIGNSGKLDPSTWTRLAADLAGGPGSPAQVAVDDIMAVRETAGHLIDGYGDRARAFLQVQNGCDHRCTFCIIPFGRGPSRSTPIAEVAAQARRLSASGHREIVLTGFDITSWGGDISGAPRLGDLVAAVLDAAPDLHRLRLSSIDVAEVDDRLFELLAGEPRVAPHAHLSLQAGDDMILKRMKRRHSRADAIAFCKGLRARREGVAFGADVIVGFPTETDEMFANTLAIVEEAGLQYLHVFPFSPRAGTPAARMPAVDPVTVKARAARLREAGDDAHRRFLDRLVGERRTAIIESGGRARLDNFAEARLEGSEPGGDVGALVAVDIVAREGKTLRARAAA